MSNLHHFGYYVPVTSFPNEPIDRTRWPDVDTVGLDWGAGSAFDYSARLRFNEDQSGLTLNLKEGGTLPKKRIVLEAECKVEEDEVTIGPFLQSEAATETDIYAVAKRIAWHVSTQLPKVTFSQGRPPTRTYDYLLEEVYKLL